MNLEFNVSDWWTIKIFWCVAVFTPPPKQGEDPFSPKSLLPALGYVARMKDGVIYVYKDQADADKHQPLALPASDYATFIDDMNFLIALIAQGPTWVLQWTKQAICLWWSMCILDG